MAEFSGHLNLRAARRDDGRTAIASQAFRAPFHLSKPYWDEPSRTLLVQVVNPTAGILSGDRLSSEIAADAGAALMVTTPSASRVFHMREGEARCEQRFVIARGAWLEVAPEPLVPHRESSYCQHTHIEVAEGGAAFFVDQLTAGRVAHGETWSWKRLQLTTEVRLGGELILRERFDQTGPELSELARLAGSGPEACFANAVLISSTDNSSEWRPEVAALHADGLWIGVSALRRGGWSLKLVANDSVRLRRGLSEVRRRLSRSFPHLTCDARKL